MPNERSTLNPQPSTEPMSDALKFLLVCCKTDPSEADINFVCSFLNTERLMLNALIALANQHGILPLVYKTLKQFQSESAFTHHELLPAFKQQYLNIARRNMLMSAELIRIMKLLEENNIEALAFKGPALSQMAYGDITLRQYADLDILTKKEDIYKIDTLLKSQGYERLLALTPTQEKIWIKYAHDLGLIHPTKGVHLEMHWSFLDEDYPMQVNLENFWEETQKIKLNGYTVPTFSNENLLVYLCIHGSKHLWERIEWIKDIDLLIRGNEIDWQNVIEKSRESGFVKMIYLGLSLSALLFSTPLSETIKKEILNYQHIDTLSKFILESWQTPKSTFQTTATILKLFPGMKERLIYLHKILIKPSFNEYWYIDFPKGFYWLYYFLRPYLLIKKYFTKQDV